jgi:hypothetical protein
VATTRLTALVMAVTRAARRCTRILAGEQIKQPAAEFGSKKKLDVLELGVGSLEFWLVCAVLRDASREKDGGS